MNKQGTRLFGLTTSPVTGQTFTPGTAAKGKAAAKGQVVQPKKVDPRIKINDGPAATILEDARKALVLLNKVVPARPTILAGIGGSLAVRELGGFSHWVDPKDMGVALSRYVSFDARHDMLPDPIVKMLMLRSGLPELKSVPSHPYLKRAANGEVTLMDKNLYDAEMGIELCLDKDLAGIDAEIASFRTAAEAMAYLFDDVFLDFKTRFVNEQSCAHFLAMLCQPYVRHLIKGPTPLYVLRANEEGTGKSLLAEFHGAILTGMETMAATQWTLTEGGEDKMRRAMVAKGLKQPAYIFFDNVNYKVDSGLFASMLTSGRIAAVPLYGDKEEEYPYFWQWIMTANNPQFSPEIARRVVSIPLQKARGEISHDEYRYTVAWVAANRRRAMAAVLKICYGGLQTLSTVKAPRFDSYESWMSVMWPIMCNVGATEFNPAVGGQKIKSSDDVEFEAFARAIFKNQKDDRFETVKSMMTWADSEQVSLPGIKSTDPDAQVRELGRALAKRRGQLFGPYRLDVREDPKGNAYRFVKEFDDPLLELCEAARG